MTIRVRVLFCFPRMVFRNMSRPDPTPKTPSTLDEKVATGPSLERNCMSKLAPVFTWCLILSLLTLLGGCSRSESMDSPEPGLDFSEGGSGEDAAPGEERVVQYRVEVCDGEPLRERAGCMVEPGTSGSTLLRGTLLLPDRVVERGGIIIDANGVMTCVGCGCMASLEDTLVDCGGAVVSPGLINTHDHLGWTHRSPEDWGVERFEHRHDWRKGKRGHSKVQVSGGASKENKMWGELRQLMAGTTTLAGAGDTVGLVRNLDTNNRQEGLGQEEVELSTFPLGDSSGQLLADSCDYNRLPSASVLNYDAWLPHVGEGIDDEARNEILCLTRDADGGRAVAGKNGTFIHAVGVNAEDARLLGEAETSVSWSPRSNISLYGNTAPVTLLAQSGVNLALGTDWTPSGSMNLLREFRCAEYLNRFHFDSKFTSQEIWLMGTRNAARALAVDDAVGVLAPGFVADLAIYGNEVSDPYGKVLGAGPGDVYLVLRGGEAIYGDSEVLLDLREEGDGCERLPRGVCQRDKSICLFEEIGQSFGDLELANRYSYDLFYCDEPEGEPTCVPSRPGEYVGVGSPRDLDGDGVVNYNDNCPRVFNPVRPLDDGVQGDADLDGQGDVCDVCPLLANSLDCELPRGGDALPSLVGFTREEVFTEVGDEARSFHDTLEITLDRVVVGEAVVITLHTIEDEYLEVPEEVVIVPGRNSAEVIGRGLGERSESVELIARFNGEEVRTRVRVLSPGRTPLLLAVTPNPLGVYVGEAETLKIKLSEPAPQEGTVVRIENDGAVVSLEEEVRVPYWDDEVDVVVLAGGTVGSSVLSIALEEGGRVEVEVVVSEAPPLGLVLSEVFLNAAGSDDQMEWVELYNGNGEAVELEGYALGYTSGSAPESGYAAFTYGLRGRIESGECVVVGGVTSNDGNGNPVFLQSQDFHPDIQNSGAGKSGHGVALFSGGAEGIRSDTVPLDAVIYGGDNRRYLINSEGEASPETDVAAPGEGQSLVRGTEGWRVSDLPSPGACPALP